MEGRSPCPRILSPPRLGVGGTAAGSAVGVELHLATCLHLNEGGMAGKKKEKMLFARERRAKTE